MSRESKKFHSHKLSFTAPRTIVLVGLMGSGKTSIGRRLAKRLELPFVDSDHEIEKAAGCSLDEIFELYGAESFRSGEKRVIQRLLNNSVQVLATGGGAFIEPETRVLIQESAISIWLKADIDTLLSRISRRQDRPFLPQENQQRETLENLIKDQYPIYEEADVVVDTYDEPTMVTVDRVIDLLTPYIHDHFPTQYVIKNG